MLLEECLQPWLLEALGVDILPQALDRLEKNQQRGMGTSKGSWQQPASTVSISRILQTKSVQLSGYSRQTNLTTSRQPHQAVNIVSMCPTFKAVKPRVVEPSVPRSRIVKLVDITARIGTLAFGRREFQNRTRFAAGPTPTAQK